MVRAFEICGGLLLAVFIAAVCVGKYLEWRELRDAYVGRAASRFDPPKGKL